MPQTLLEMAKDLMLAQIQAQQLSPEDMHTALQSLGLDSSKLASAFAAVLLSLA